MKTLFTTADGRPVEAVLMRYRDGRRSLCLSSQSGCPLTCTFCATGRMKFGRNLTVGEILMAPINPVVVSELAPASLRGAYQGGFSLAMSLAACLAPVLGTSVL